MAPVNPKQKVGLLFLFFRCSSTKCDCFTFAPQHTDQNKHFPVQDDSSSYTSRKETKTVNGQRKTGWHVWMVSCSGSHTQTQTDGQAHTGKHPLHPSRVWIEVPIKIKTKKTRPVLSALRDVKSKEHPYHTHIHTQSVRKTTQLPPFSWPGSS